MKKMTQRALCLPHLNIGKHLSAAAIALTMTTMTAHTANAEVLTGICGATEAACSWSYNTINYTLTIAGNGAMSTGVSLTDEQKGEVTNLSISGITRIDGGGYNAFKGFSSLTSVTIPNSVTYIGMEAFQDCTSLTSITIPNSVTIIDYYAFQGTGITSVSIPASVTTIRGFAFSFCPGLTSITIPSSVTTIGEGAFIATGITSVFIPASVTSMSFIAFNTTCTYSVDANNPNYSSTNGVLFDKNKTTLLRYPRETTTAPYTIPSSVTTIAEHAFDGCYALTSVTMPNGLTSIGNNAFIGCTALTSITIPSGVTTIGDNAFNGCTGLTSVYNDAAEPQTINSNVFSHVSNATLYVPASAVAAYQAADGWKNMNIAANPSSGGDEGSCEMDLFNANMKIMLLRADSMAMRMQINQFNILVEQMTAQLEQCANLGGSSGNCNLSGLQEQIAQLTAELAACRGGANDVALDALPLLAVYPNPAGDMLYITDEYDGLVEIYDINGALLLTSTSNSINVSTLPSGIYIVKAGGKAAKVVKQ